MRRPCRSPVGPTLFAHPFHRGGPSGHTSPEKPRVSTGAAGATRLHAPRTPTDCSRRNRSGSCSIPDLPRLVPGKALDDPPLASPRRGHGGIGSLFAILALAGACGLEASGLSRDGGDEVEPEAADGEVVRPGDGRDEGGGEDDGDDGSDVTAFCGNGRVEGEEQCDDGDPDDTDDCPTTCRFAYCGDGFLRAGLEACDMGAANSDTTPDACRADCTLPRCGDGVRDTGEACDDGNADETDGCLSSCRTSECGNGRRDGSEECDDGNTDDTDACLSTCVAARCGDGHVQAGVEQCDGGARDCTTSCGSTGRQDCSGCTWSTCAPPAERCNGRDDDCDTAADNGFACRPGETTSCATSCGSTGTGICTDACAPPGPAACTVPAESCNGRDDDCDGETDEGFTRYCDVPHDHPERDLCVDPGETVCNGADDNCDGRTDEGFECCPGATRSCATPCGAAGTQGCVEGNVWGSCCAPAEVCQTVGSTACDDNCDGRTDEGCGTVVPPNDTCDRATPITASGRVHGDTTTATNTATPSCASGAGRDVWYTFTLDRRRIVYIDTVDSGSWNTVIEVRSGACPGTPVAEACNDDACGGRRSQLVLTLDPGTYYVLVDGRDAADAGPFDMLFQWSGCLSPRITTNGDRDGNTSASHNYLGGTCGGFRSGEDVYHFALCRPTSVRATTCSPATSYDTVLYFRTGSCWPGYPEPACNHDDDACGSTAAGASTISATLPQGLSFVVVDGYDGAEGAYRLNISGLP